MPEFRQPSEITVDARGEGWSRSTLADGRHVPGMSMTARRWRVEPGASTPEESWNDPAERFLYVVSGAGSLLVDGQAIELGAEDMVWVERGDRFRLAAGAQGLEILDSVSG